LFSYWRDIRQVRRSFRSAIHGSARVFSNSLTRSEQAASGNRKRAHNGACSGKFFHSAASLRLKRVLASERSCVCGSIHIVGNKKSPVFFAIAIWLSPRRATLTRSLTEWVQSRRSFWKQRLG